MLGTDVIPNGNRLIGNETVTNVLDDLSDGVHKENFGGGLGSFGNHGEGVNNWNGIEKGLDTDIPNGSDVAVFDVNSAK